MPNRGNIQRSVAFSSSGGKCDEPQTTKPRSVDDSVCSRRVVGGNKSNVYDFLQSSFNSSRSPIVRSNSFHQDVARQRKTIQASFASGFICKEDEDLLHYQKARRMSKSLPELNHLRVLPKFADALGHYKDLSESIIDDDEEDATSSCIATDTEYHPAWANKSDFLMTVMGFSLGLNALWRFPYFCYINDGGSFLLAYTILMLFCGLPLLCLEYAVGQLTHRSSVVFGYLSPILKGTSISSMIITCVLVPVYSAVNSWSMLYFFKSFHPSPSWSHCNNKWNENPCLTSHSPFITVAFHSHLLTKNSSIEVDLTETTTQADLTTQEPSTSAYSPSDIPPAFQYASQQFFDNRLMGLDLETPLLGVVKWDLAIILFFMWIIIFVSLRKGYVFSSNSTFCLAIVPTMALGLLFLKAVFLNGARKGLIFFLKPSLNGILEPYVWLYAAGFTFHSLGCITGLSLGMAKYNRDRNNFMRDSIIACLINYISVLVVGCIVFSVIGHLSVERKVDIARVLMKEPGLSYVAMSELLSSMPMKTLWSCIFFFMQFCLGIDFLIAHVATFIECVKDMWKSQLWRKGFPQQILVLSFCIMFFSFSLLFVTQKGLVLIRIVDHHVTVILTVVLALLEVIMVGCFYGAKNLVNAIKVITCKAPGFYFSSSWSFWTPFTLMAIICSNLYETVDFNFRGISNTFITSIVGPTLIIIGTIPIPVFALLELRQKDDKIDFFRRFCRAFRPEGDPIGDLKQGNTGGKTMRTHTALEYYNSKDTGSYDAEAASSDYIPPITYSLIQGLDRETAI